VTDIDKADVYRKAAEVIVRDGKTDCGLTEAGEQDEDLKNPELAVCALGACARAHYELYGELPRVTYEMPGRSGTKSPADSVYQLYSFSVPKTADLQIWMANDGRDGVTRSAEDIALLLKQHAAELDEEAGE